MTYICLFIIIGCGFIVDHLISTNIVPVMFVLDPSYLSTIFSASITLAGFGIAVVSLLPNSFDKTYYGYSMKEIIRMKESNVSINTFIKVTFLCMAFGLLGLILVSYNLITAVFIFLLFVNFNYFRKIFKIITNDLECEHIVTAYIETQSSRKDTPSLKDEINTHLLNYLSDLSKTSSTEQKDAVWNMFWTFNKEIWSKPSDNIKSAEQQINVCSDFTNKIIKLFTLSVDSTLFTSYFKTILCDNTLPSENKISLIEHGMSAVKVSDFITLSSMNVPKKIRDFKAKNKENFGIEDLYKIYIQNVIEHPTISENEKIELISVFFKVLAEENSLSDESLVIEKKLLCSIFDKHVLHFSNIENAKIVLSAFVSFTAAIINTSYVTYDIGQEIAKIYAKVIYALFTTVKNPIFGTKLLFTAFSSPQQKKQLYDLFFDLSQKQPKYSCMFFDLLSSRRKYFGINILKHMTSWLSPSFFIPTEESNYNDFLLYYSNDTRSWATIHLILYLVYCYKYQEPRDTYFYSIKGVPSIFETYDNWDQLVDLDGRNYKPTIFSAYSVFDISKGEINFQKEFAETFDMVLNISVTNRNLPSDFIIHAFETINDEKAKYYSAPWLSESFCSTKDDWTHLIEPFEFDEGARYVVRNQMVINVFSPHVISYPFPITRKEFISIIFRRALPEIRLYFDQELEAVSDPNTVKQKLKNLNITHRSFNMGDIWHGDNDNRITNEFRKEISPLLDHLIKIDYEKWNGFYLFNQSSMKFSIYAEVTAIQPLSDEEIQKTIAELPKLNDKYFYQSSFFNALLTYEDTIQAIKNDFLQFHVSLTIKTSICRKNAFRIDAHRTNSFDLS